MRPQLRLVKSYPSTRTDLERLDLEQLKTIQSSSGCPAYLAGWIGDEIQQRNRSGKASPNTPPHRTEPKRPA